MALGDILAGQGVNQASSAPAPTAPAARNDPEFQQRKQGWLGALQEMTQDPATAMMLIQFGNSMLNSGGQSTGQAISGALTDAMRLRGQMALQDEERRKQEAETARKTRMEERQMSQQDRRIGLEEQRVGQAEQRMQLEREAQDATAEYRRQSLAVDRLRAQAAMASANRPTATSLQAAENEKYIAALQAVENLTEDEAIVRSRERTKGKTLQEMALDIYKTNAAADAKERAQLLPGQSMPPFQRDAEMEAAMRLARMIAGGESGAPSAPQMTEEQIDAEAQAAIEKGADPAAVRQRAEQLKQQLRTGGGF